MKQCKIALHIFFRQLLCCVMFMANPNKNFQIWLCAQDQSWKIGNKKLKGKGENILVVILNGMVKSCHLLICLDILKIFIVRGKKL